MAVEVLNHGTTVRVTPDDVTVCDLLHYALVALEEFEWRQGDRKGRDDDMMELAQTEGLSLHDAVGLANQRLVSHRWEAEGEPRYRDKDAPYQKTNGEWVKLRDEAYDLIRKHTPGGKTDIEFNDAAKSKDEVLDLLRTVIQKECS